MVILACLFFFGSGWAMWRCLGSDDPLPALLAAMLLLGAAIIVMGAAYS